MCGIAGVMLGGTRPALPWRELLNKIGNTLRHRGPDDGGTWWDENDGIGLVHRRLSIVDLSEEGHQPMRSRNGRFVISFNGEIYNFREIRNQLDYAWRGHSDTEVLLAAIETWGLAEAITRCTGMFAFALWDREYRTLSLVRDRMGVKPLYVGLIRGGLIFGSELKALRIYPEFNPQIDKDSLTLLLRYGYIPSPYSIYKDTWKLEPGKVITIKVADAAHPDRWSHEAYWSLRSVAEAGTNAQLDMGPQEAVTHLEKQVSLAVGRRMEADVPLGAFLSGGIDSSTVVALMQAQSSRPVRTFAIGFEEEAFNEAPYAKAVAHHLGTDHTEMYVTANEAMATIPELPSLYDEPFADSSQIPTYLVSQLARRDVTVALSGDGGDELFFGYRRYLFAERLLRRVGWIPSGSRTALARLLLALPAAGWERALGSIRSIMPRAISRRLHGRNVHLLAQYLCLLDPKDIYNHVISACHHPEDLVSTATEPPTALSDYASTYGFGFSDLMMYLDGVSYLPDDILVKVDRATMAVGLEARNPFLDHGLVEFSWQIPTSLKIRDGIGKWILREVLYRHVPRELLERPKKGFSVPIGAWLRGPLKEWAETLLDDNSLRRQAYLRHEPVRAIWKEHLSGEGKWDYILWNILMFQAWLSSMETVGLEAPVDDRISNVVGSI